MYIEYVCYSSTIPQVTCGGMAVIEVRSNHQISPDLQFACAL